MQGGLGNRLAAVSADRKGGMQVRANSGWIKAGSDGRCKQKQKKNKV